MTIFKKNLMNRLPDPGALWSLVVGMLIPAVLVHIWGSPAPAAQTREQCHRCCQAKGLDEYYLEQCKLKCFRNPDHCGDQRSTQPPTAADETAQEQTPPKPVRRPPAVVRKPPIQPPATGPGYPPATGPPPAAERQPPMVKSRGLVFPNPLNLAPGKEEEAAAQILAANGIPPQHPQYQFALQSIQAVLLQFIRANPAGGKLPTAELERIIRQIR